MPAKRDQSLFHANRHRRSPPSIYPTTVFMSLYRVTTTKLESVPPTTFAAEKILERKDLQRLLKQDISPVGDDLLVIAEEFGEWEDSSRRIDLLCLSRDADLVVVEIKRTEDGGHMELQAVRYAAMVSSMTLEQVVDAYAKAKPTSVDAARCEILDFIRPDSDEPSELSGRVRIVLVSADFSTELTTAVLWLNQHDLDITCIRLRPYKLGADLLIDAAQIIPLPESADYEVKIRAKEQEKKKAASARGELFRRFWAQLIERSKPKTPLLANRTTSGDHWLSAGIGRSGFSLHMTLTRQRAQVECYIRLPGGDEKNTEAFTALLKQKAEIETNFGSELDWQELPDRIGCRICKELNGGWQVAESEWPAMQDSMIDALIRLEKALKKPVQDLTL